MLGLRGVEAKVFKLMQHNDGAEVTGLRLYSNIANQRTGGGKMAVILDVEKLGCGRDLIGLLVRSLI